MREPEPRGSRAVDGRRGHDRHCGLAAADAGPRRPARAGARRRQLPEFVRAGGAGGVPARRRDAALVLVRLRRQDVQGRPREGSRLRDGVLGHGARSARQQPVVARRRDRTPKPRGRSSRTRVPCPGQDRARAGMAGRGARLLPESRHGAGGEAAHGLQRRDEEVGDALPERHRGAGVLRAHAPGLGVEDGPDLRQSARGGRDSREGLRGESAASRRDALHHPRLRLRAAGHRAAFRRRAATPASRRPCRTRATCRRTSIRWRDCGRTRSPRTCRRSRFSRTITTPRTSPCTPTCSWRRIPRPAA